MPEYDPKEIAKLVDQTLKSREAVESEGKATRQTITSKKEYVAITKQQIDVLRGLSSAFQPVLLVQNTESGLAAKAKKDIDDAIQSRRITIETLRTEEQTRTDLLAQEKKALDAGIEAKKVKEENKIFEAKAKSKTQLLKIIEDQRVYNDTLLSEMDSLKSNAAEKAKALKVEQQWAQFRQSTITITKEVIADRQKELATLQEDMIARSKVTQAIKDSEVAKQKEIQQMQFAANLRKQGLVVTKLDISSRKEQLEVLKRQIISNNKIGNSYKTQIPKLKRLKEWLLKVVGAQRKLNKASVLGVRNQRNLHKGTKAFGSTLSVWRSKLLIASFAIGLVQKAVSSLINEYAKYQAAQSRVNAALKSTGFASGQSVKGLSKLASEIQKNTGVSDTLTLSSSALLATFTQVGGETFPTAQKAIVDMTAAMNAGQVTQEGLRSSTVQVGKALNAPIKGITALSRVGVAFTAQQKKTIKSFVNSGQVAKAQAIILKELNKEFGNTASADSYEKSMRQLDSAFGDLQKDIGLVLLPVFEIFIEFLKDTVFWVSENKKAIVEYTVALGLAAGAMKTFMGFQALGTAAATAGITKFQALKKVVVSLAKRAGYLGLAISVGFFIKKLISSTKIFDGFNKKVGDSTNAIGSFNSETRAVSRPFAALTDPTLHSGLDNSKDKLAKLEAQLLSLKKKRVGKISIPEVEPPSETDNTQMLQIVGITGALERNKEAVEALNLIETAYAKQQRELTKVVDDRNLVDKMSAGFRLVGVKGLFMSNEQLLVAEKREKGLNVTKKEGIQITIDSEAVEANATRERIEGLEAEIQKRREDILARQALPPVIQGSIDKYTEQIDVLNAVGAVNKELVKVSQSLSLGSDTLTNALENEKHMYHGLAKVIEEVATNKIPQATQKYKNQLVVLKEKSSIDKELIKLSQELFGNDTELTTGLEEQRKKYDAIMAAQKKTKTPAQLKALKEEIEKNEELVESLRAISLARDVQALKKELYAETLNFASLHIDAEIAKQNELMQNDIENVKKTSAYKIAQKLGDNARMKQLEKDAMKATFPERKKLAEQNLALAIGQIALSTAVGMMKAFEDYKFPAGAIVAGLVAAVGALQIAAATKANPIPKFARGGDFVTAGPQTIMVGDNPGGRERVQVTPLSSPNIAGPEVGASVVVNVSGNVLTQDFVEGELADNIKEAIRRGADFGIS